MKALPRPLLPSVSLVDIARHSGLTACSDAQISSVVSDNRCVRPGDMFAALPREHTHGARFIEDAFERGACAILTDGEVAWLNSMIVYKFALRSQPEKSVKGGRDDTDYVKASMC